MCVFFRLRNMYMKKMKVRRFSGGYVMSVGLWFAMCGVSTSPLCSMMAVYKGF
ncbi:hypothetical protein Lalb_Chr03g0041151 [Lupinus albus]|uniref:Uncharacterized protein n=1 Tax=Lupinus albus TaxID=3870 RepID=A0A6A4QT30_LUPAL|nr:hypothetical protein Lalb_Chr03g0041151 [Lupinus albus]